MTSSEHKPYHPGYGQVGHHEWRTAENSTSYLLPILQEQVAKKPELTLLDIGAGSGTITADLASYMPRGHIVAADISDEILERAKAHARKMNKSNIEFRMASVYDLTSTFGKHEFDIVHTSMVLCHLDDPVSALIQMIQVCKPGGIVAVRESDLRMMNFFPATSAMHAWHALLLRTHAKNGGSIDGGSRLLSWALDAGAKREQMTLTMSTWCYTTPEEKNMWSNTIVSRLTTGAWKQQALENGIANEMEIDEMKHDWQMWAKKEDACYGSMHGELILRL